MGSSVSCLVLKIPYVRHEAYSNDLAEFHRDGIANESPDRFFANGFSGCDEFVFFRKTLQNSSLTKGECSILLGMAKPAIAESVKLRGNCR